MGSRNGARSASPRGTVNSWTASYGQTGRSSLAIAEIVKGVEVSLSQTLMPGQTVSSLDWQFLGHVAKVADSGFLVAGPGHDGWLRRDAVFTADDRHVTLLCNTSRLDQYAYSP